MTKKKFVWEIYLHLHTLSKDTERDCIADVRFRGGAKRNEDIADIITKERSEFRRETIINILNLRDEAVKKFIQDGMSFIDGIVQIAPRVTGVWKTENALYNAVVHKRTVDLIPTHNLKDLLDDITVKVLGVKDDSFRITSVTDTATGLSDGTIMIGDDLIIEGEKSKSMKAMPLKACFSKAPTVRSIKPPAAFRSISPVSSSPEFPLRFPKVKRPSSFGRSIPPVPKHLPKCAKSSLKFPARQKHNPMPQSKPL